MGRIGIISVDGHVKASRRGYREYLDPEFRDDYDAFVASQEKEGIPDAGNIGPEFPHEAQWDSKTRQEKLESVGVVAEVLFPNGMPFQVNRLEDFGKAQDRRLLRAGMVAYNRWLADFCAELPGRRFGNAVVSFSGFFSIRSPALRSRARPGVGRLRRARDAAQPARRRGHRALPAHGLRGDHHPGGGRAADFFHSNCRVGISPFTNKQIPFADLTGVSESGEKLDGFHIGAERTMFGLDYPHFESRYCVVEDEVRALLDSPCFTDADVENVLFRNAAKVYGFDLAALEPVALRIGVELDDYRETA